MSRRVFRISTLAILLIASFCWVGIGSKAEAGWGHFHHRHFNRHHHHYGFRVGWPSYSYYSFAPYRVSYPVYHRSYYSMYRYPVYRSYVPYYYTTPHIDCGCCGYGYGYRPTVSYGSYYASNSGLSDPGASLKPSLMSPRVQPATPVLARDSSVISDHISLKLNVPEDARVTINDRLTSASGIERTFVVRGGLAADSYPFVVRAEVERDGRMVSQTQRISLRGGQTSSLTFDLDAEAMRSETADDVVNTAVRLRVPKNARVFLAGHEMKQTGELRVFETNKLRAGEEIENYSVRVVMGDLDADSREKQLTLVGGETQEIAFDFASSAQRLVTR